MGPVVTEGIPDMANVSVTFALSLLSGSLTIAGIFIVVVAVHVEEHRPVVGMLVKAAGERGIDVEVDLEIDRLHQERVRR